MGERRARMGRRGKLFRYGGGAAVAVVASALVIGTAFGVGADDDARDTPKGGNDDVATKAASSTFPLADPDTLLTEDGTYVTYGTTVPAGAGERCGAGDGELFVPVLEHGSGNDVGMSDCAVADAFPGGPGDWAEGAIWAPGVTKFGDRYFMFYTATKAGTGQKCVGRAIADNARGPFQDAGEWACGPNGRWAIDANPFVHDGELYVTYRDDAMATAPHTGISTVRTNAEGQAIWDTRRDILSSDKVNWDGKNAWEGQEHTIENPTMWEGGDGHWYVAYAGNNWDSDRYATGIADCGTSPLPDSPCTPINEGAERPYFGFTGDTGINPIKGLPENKRGPGGMDVFTAEDGSYRVVWHWWDGEQRYPMTGVLHQGEDGFSVS